MHIHVEAYMHPWPNFPKWFWVVYVASSLTWLQTCISLSNCIHLIASVSPKGNSMRLHQQDIQLTYVMEQTNWGLYIIIIRTKSCIGLANVREAEQMFIFDNQQAIS